MRWRCFNAIHILINSLGIPFASSQNRSIFANQRHDTMPKFDLYANLLRPIAFRMDPERAHYATMWLLGIGLAIPLVGWALRRKYAVTDNPVEVAGLRFRHPIGLAAGFDKDGRWLHALKALGFAYVEVGTVTPRPQPGNPAPRLFRVKADRALINRMGFNNGGLDALVERLKHRPAGLIVGGNIGRNKSTPNERATEDYLACLNGLHAHVDYFVVNVSSPNTPGLRELQERAPLTALLGSLSAANDQLASQSQAPARPIFLKIAPDLSNAQLDDIVAIVQETGISGVVATNTTISRAGLSTPPSAIDEIGAGGLSGAPVRARSTEVVRYLRERADFPIIGVGGVEDGPTALEKREAGAQLVQVYSGMVYTGPSIIRLCAEAL
jgi:dihydroorotate dehydrogenase